MGHHPVHSYVGLEPFRLEEPLAAQVVLLEHTTPSHGIAYATPLLLGRTLLHLDMLILSLVGVHGSSRMLDSHTALVSQALDTMVFHQTETASPLTRTASLATIVWVVTDIRAMELRIKTNGDPLAASRHHQTCTTFQKGPLQPTMLYLSSVQWDSTALVVIALHALPLGPMWTSLAMLQQAASLSFLDTM